VISEFTRGRVASPLFYSLKTLALFVLPHLELPV
jgi:hypothetical protein